MFPFLDWLAFFARGFQIIDHNLPDDTVILVDLRYIQVRDPSELNSKIKIGGSAI